MDLQELITRGRHIFSNAPARLIVFKDVNGKLTAKDMAAKLNRHVNSVRADLRCMLDAGLIQNKVDRTGNAVIKDKFPIYEKIPLARTISFRLFEATAKRPAAKKAGIAVVKSQKKPKRQNLLPVPSEQEILDICKQGEDQINEFKGQGVEPRKISREIAAMLNTRDGGRIFYGIDDEGTIEGSDHTLQKFDQQLQNSLHNMVDPPPTVKLNQVSVLGSNVIVITVPPWNRRDVYHYDGRVLIRKGTNVFNAKSAENKKLHKGQHWDS